MNVDIFENENELLFVADVPGVTEDKLTVSLDRGELSLVGEAGERTFRRAFTVPQSIDADKVAAELKHGVLRVTLPKAAAAKPRQIPIQIA